MQFLWKALDLLLRIPHVGLAVVAPVQARHLLNIYVQRQEMLLQRERLETLSAALKVSESLPQRHRRELLAAIVGHAIVARAFPQAERKRKY